MPACGQLFSSWDLLRRNPLSPWINVGAFEWDHHPLRSDSSRNFVDFPIVFCYLIAVTNPIPQGQPLVPTIYGRGHMTGDTQHGGCTHTSHAIEISSLYGVIHSWG